MNYNVQVVLAFFKAEDVPTPDVEFKFHPERKWRFDFAWPHYLLGLEVEGGAAIHGRHTQISGFRKDMEKYNAAAVLGWRLIRVMPENLLRVDTTNLLHAALSETHLVCHICGDGIHNECARCSGLLDS